MVNDKILLAREKRREIIKELSENSDLACVKANVPGWDKNIPQANVVIYLFSARLEKMGGYEFRFLRGADGLAVLCKIDNGAEFKNKTENLENNHFLGRLVDIDVYLKGEGKSLLRKQMRKCFLCDNSAFVCGRNKTHTIGELLAFFTKNTEKYITDEISSIIERSMLAELDIENKFGLVTPTSCGSHKDLNYQLMIKAIDVLKHPLSKAFILGLTVENLERLIDRLKQLGVECEAQMLKVTNGSNAYKGFIFVGGIILATVGMLVKNGLTLDHFNKACRNICNNFSYPNDTFGATAYRQGFGGIRECALNGFDVVEKAEAMIDKYSLEEILTYIVGNISDSVLYKRAGNLERYNYYKQLISTVGRDRVERENLTKQCIQNNISIGGSADILISCKMLNELKKFLFCEKI